MTGRMAIGPVEYIVVEFPENRFSGEIVPALRDLVESGTIRILDLLFITKDAHGNVGAVEVEQDEALSDFLSIDGEVGGILSHADVEHVGDGLAPNSSAGLLVWEDLWATRFVEALRNAGGSLLEGARVPPELVEDVLATIHGTG